MKRKEPIRCKHCKELSAVDRRNMWHQRYCNKAECKRASKAASQKRWLRKPENRNYFKGGSQVQRVQEWRARNPGYWRKKNIALQEVIEVQVAEKTIEKEDRVLALQDLIRRQALGFTGLISCLTGATLQEEIALTVTNLIKTGQDIQSSILPPGG